MIRNKYKIEKKSPLELKAEEVRDSIASTTQDAHKTTRRSVKLAKKAAKANAKVTKKQAKIAGVVARKAAKTAPVALAGVAATAAHTASEKAAPLVEQVAEKAAPVQEKGHEVLTEAILPRVVEALTALAASAESAKSDAADKAATLKDSAQDKIVDAKDSDDHSFAKTAAGLLTAKAVKNAVSDDHDRKRGCRCGAKKAAKAAGTAALLAKAKDAVEPEPKKKSKGGTTLMVLGLIAAGAAAALTAYKQLQPQDDPWSTPLLDPYVTPTQGRDATVAFSADETGTNADLTPAEVAQGGDATSILSPVENQHLSSSAPSTAAELPTDDGAGQLLDDPATGNGDGDIDKA